MTFYRSVLWTGAFAALMALSDVRDADACGGCFHPTVESSASVVTDHRMVFEITTTQTILWDQVRYSGNPTEFAWVLPVRAGSRVELSHGELITALDNATATSVVGPEATCTSGRATVTAAPARGSSSGGGCGGSSALSDSEYAGGDGYYDASARSDAGSFGGTSTVDVVSQSTIGPYQSVTIHAKGKTGIQDWLVENGFSVPEYMAPVIDSYTSQDLDFIALRLRPNVGVQAMRPVRVITPGADAQLPLRMVAAGIGAHVGLTLWVIGEGRYQAQNFPNDTIDWRSQLTWNATANRSNRAELEASALAANGGHTWVTEAALTTDLSPDSYSYRGTLPSLGVAYNSLCQSSPPRTVPCDDTSLPPEDGQPDAGDPDAGADAGDEDEDAGDDGGDAGLASDAGPTTTDAGPNACYKTQYGCDGFDDLDLVAEGLHVGNIWITRLRADLPASALNAELQLAASPSQSQLSPSFTTTTFNPPYDPCNPTGAANNPASSSSTGSGSDGCVCRAATSRGDLGTWSLIGATMVALRIANASRRRRRRP